ncbi:tetratricopeptide repeat protein [Variovorax sp. WS11]|uniref:tetratricopeptide repeat protein n=1 Tax=Variovorax sp. WS11 TaxID=1105204 RepID=UPI0013DD3A58|nr:tetratricopeptide repeat protein [Variovorax sp. WS11]NDZ14664.1 tetratricopeptide repeat protein [Variovorax sp. WS11]
MREKISWRRWLVSGFSRDGQRHGRGRGAGRRRSRNWTRWPGQTAVKAEQWSEAVGHLDKAIRTDPKNADAWNLLGFAYRHMGQMDKSFQHYEKALELNPRHRDAHEYVGEAYLQVGQLEGAEKHLKALDKLCWFPCEQYTELKEKIEKFKRTRVGG